MAYTVAHVDKAKAGKSGGLTLHVDRTQEKKVSADIDTSRSSLNFELIQRTGTIDDMIKQRIKEGHNGKRKVRKDAVTSCRFILSGSHEEMKDWSDKKIKQWAVDNYKYFAKWFGEKNIIRATVHRDEKTPHMHLITVPLTSDGRLSAKDYIGGKEKLRQFQTDYAEKIGKKYNLERGVKDSNRKHITTRDYYRYINKNEMTAESILNSNKNRELVGKLVELADQNKKELKTVTHKNIRDHEQQQSGRNQKGNTGREQKGRINE